MDRTKYMGRSASTFCIARRTSAVRPMGGPATAVAAMLMKRLSVWARGT